MGRYAQDSGGGDFQQAPIGTHVGVCVRITDLGTQTSEYQGQVNERNQILVTWELPNEMMETDKGPAPFIVSKFYTNSLNEKATLRHDLTQWRGRDFTDEELGRFDLQSILGAPCMISVIANDKGKSKVGGVMKLPKGTPVPKPKNAPQAFWLDHFDRDAFEALSEGIKKIIMKSPEYQEAVNGKPKVTKFDAMEGMKDDIPF